MIGLRTTWTLCKNFVAEIRGDVGGFGLVVDENVDCDLEAGIAWQFHRNTYLDLAYRARGQWQNLGSPHHIAVRDCFAGGAWRDLQILGGRSCWRAARDFTNERIKKTKSVKCNFIESSKAVERSAGPEQWSRRSSNSRPKQSLNARFDHRPCK